MTVILVAVTILFFLGLDWLVRTRKQREPVPAYARHPAVARTVRVRLPSGVFFAPSHTWLNLFPSGEALVGVDDFVARLLDEPRVTLLKRSGERVGKGEPLLQLESNGRSMAVRSPIAGHIVSSNAELERDPKVLGRSPFTEGWAYAVKPSRPSDIKELLLGEEARTWIRDEFSRLRDVFATAVPQGRLSAVMLQDGGPPICGAMKQVEDPVWKRFEDEFLQVR